MTYFYSYQTLLGPIWFYSDENAITRITCSPCTTERDLCRKETPLIKKAYAQIQEYLQGQRKTFDLPLHPAGTSFQQKVWTALQTIPYGETWSYKKVAQTIGNDKGCRAVGMANNKNPILLVIPCHRVIGINGQLVGYGAGLDKKEFLLRLEQENK